MGRILGVIGVGAALSQKVIIFCRF